MGILSDLRISKVIDKFLAADDVNDSETMKLFSRLKDQPQASVPRLIERLAMVDAAQRARISAVLAVTLDNQTLPLFIEGLASNNPKITDTVSQVLSNSRAYDASRLVLQLNRAEVSEAAIVKVLQAQKSRLSAKALLTEACKMDRVRQTPLFGILADIAGPDLIPDLVVRASAKEPTIRMHVSRILARFDQPEARQALAKLISDPQKAVRISALRGIASMEARPDLDPVIEALRDPDFNVQDLAIDIIVKFHDAGTLNKIGPLIMDESNVVRRAAVEILNILGDADSIRSLLSGLRDQDWWVRERAADALVSIGGPKVVEAMSELIKDEDEFIRRTAVEVLAATDDQSAFDQLLESLDDSDWWVRERAIDALAAIGDVKAVPLLKKALNKDSHTRLAAVRALGNIGEPSAVRDILACLSDDSEAVVKQTIESLGQLTNEVSAYEVSEALKALAERSSDEIRGLVEKTLHNIDRRLGRATQGDTGTMNTGLNATSEETGETPVAASVSSGSQVDPATLQPGMTLGTRYEMIKRIGKGAFGTVMLFTDKVVEEQVVLKFINPQFASDELVRKRFLHEIRFARRITHHNVIRIHDFLVFGEAAAISMEYFPGHTLGDEFRNGESLEPEKARDILLQITAGLAAAHAAGIIHRDLKPANILINEAGLVKVVDFGIAAAGGTAETRLTRTGMVVGTPTYLAPEQILGKPIDSRTDIYSLGILMYQMFAGSPPYKGEDAMSLMYQHVQGNATPLHMLNPDIPKTLSAIVQKTMAVDPQKRFQSMDELHDQIARLSSQ